MTAEHGTRYRYAEGCGCGACGDAHREWKRRAAQRRAMGLSRYVEAEPVRQHVRDLMAAGMGYEQLAKRSGVGSSSLLYLMRGRKHRTSRPPRQMSAVNARALLAVSVPELAPGAAAVHVGACRRARALLAVGWPIALQAREIGVEKAVIRRLLRGLPVRQASVASMAVGYDRLWDRLPVQDTPRRRASVTSARAWAAREGWSVPMCWDDATIDDPAAKPDTGLRPGQWGAPADPVEVAELVAGRIPADAACKASREEAYRLLFADGWTAESVSAQMQVSDRTAQRAKARVSRPPTAEEAA